MAIRRSPMAVARPSREARGEPQARRGGPRGALRSQHTTRGAKPHRPRLWRSRSAVLTRASRGEAGWQGARAGRRGLRVCPTTDLLRPEGEPGESRGGIPQPNPSEATTGTVRRSTTTTLSARTPLLALGVQGAREAAPWSGRWRKRQSIRGHPKGLSQEVICRPRRRWTHRRSTRGHPTGAKKGRWDRPRRQNSPRQERRSTRGHPTGANQEAILRPGRRCSNRRSTRKVQAKMRQDPTATGQNS